MLKKIHSGSTESTRKAYFASMKKSRRSISWKICIGLLAACGSAPLCRAADSPAPDPLLTPAREHALFDALDLTSEALRPVAQAVAQGDFPLAEHQLAEYFRHRTGVAWTFAAKGSPPNSPAADPVAEDAVQGRLQGGLVMAWHTFPDNQVDWHYNETMVTPGLSHNWEWQWQLCRMSFWADLGNAYRATGDERYAKAWITQFRSFVAECPVPDAIDNRPGSAWRTIDSGIRMSHAWPTAFFSFLPSAQFTDADVALYLDSCVDHARYLKNFQTAGNWVTMEMAGLYTVGAYFPEFKEAAAWRNAALQRMEAEETAQFLPDGAQNELSTMYHNVALDSLIFIARTAQAVGRLNELPSDYIAGLERAFDYDMWLMTPDRTLPEFNDSTSWKRSVVGKCAEALEFFPDRADYKWIATDGREGTPPTETSHAFPWAGFYVMRSGWDTHANYFVVRAGPLGKGHAHQDKLNVVLWAYGRQLLFNSGGAAYEQSKWRSYSTDTFSKNTVLVDGKPQVRDPKNADANVSKSPIDARWESTPDHDFAAGVYDEGYGKLGARLATHTRRVLFVKPDLFIVADTLVPNDSAKHTYQARWNLLTTRTGVDDQTHEVTTTDEGKPNLAIVPLQTDGLEVRAVSAQSEPELLGWEVRKDMTPEALPATTVLHTWSGSGAENFLTLLVPLPAGAPNPVGSVESDAAGSALVTFSDGRKLAITADPAPTGGMEVVETLATGSPGRHVKVAAAPSPSLTGTNPAN